MRKVDWRTQRLRSSRPLRGARRCSLLCVVFSLPALIALLVVVKCWHALTSDAITLVTLPRARRRESFTTLAELHHVQTVEQVVNVSEYISLLQARSTLDPNSTDRDILSSVGHNVRAFKHLATQALASELDDVQLDLLHGLTRTLFGWLGPSRPKQLSPQQLLTTVLNLISQPRPLEASIAVACGSKLQRYAVTLVYQIRHVHRCDLPLEIFYSGELDYKFVDREALLTFHNSLSSAPIAFIDLTTLMQPMAFHIRGWDLKPFAVQFASGKQVLLLDLDVVFLQSPEQAFRTATYREFGVTWFPDRSLGLAHEGHANPISSLLRPLQPQPSASRAALRSLQDLTDFEVEAGVLAIDRRVRANVLGLLAACALKASHTVRSTLEPRYILPGDKEYFLMGWETISSPYALMPFLPGVLGNWAPEPAEPQQPSLGGRMLHFDDYGRPFWWNGGFLTCEDEARPGNWAAKQIITPTLFTAGSEHFKPQNWTWEVACACFVQTVDEASALRPLPRQYAAIANMTLAFYAHDSKAFEPKKAVIEVDRPKRTHFVALPMLAAAAAARAADPGVRSTANSRPAS